MRKGITFFCLFSFLVLQYGKLVSYWQCRLLVSTTTEYCECEKYLDDHTEKGALNNATPTISKEKSEENFLWHTGVKSAEQNPPNNTPSSPYHSLIPEDHSKNIFHPPQG